MINIQLFRSVYIESYPKRFNFHATLDSSISRYELPEAQLILQKKMRALDASNMADNADYVSICEGVK